MESPNSRLTDITFHLMVESSPSAVILSNSVGRIAYVNRQAEALFGYPAGEMIGQPVEMLMPMQSRHGHAALREGYAANPSLRAMGSGRELFALRKDGKQVPVEIGLNPLVLVDGMWVLITVVDITERKRSDERFRQVVQSAPNAMLVLNQRGIITLANRQCSVLFGYSEEELIGAPMEILFPQRLQDLHRTARDEFFAHPETAFVSGDREFCGRLRDGAEVPIELALNPIQSGDETMVLVSIIDVSGRKAQEEMRIRKEAAEAAYRAKGEMLAIATHDLKNPLASIAGLSEILLEMKEQGDDQTEVELLRSIHEAARHMSEVVQGILSNEGVEQTDVSIDAQVDLSTLVHQVVDLAAIPAQRKRIAIVVQVEIGIQYRGDARRLREAFDNYLSNAVKYSPPGTTITVRLRRTADAIEFSVQDQGPGLTAADRQKLFGKFTRLSARPTGGESSTGLGLSIVKTVVEQHGGSVGCDSEPGHGANFWVRLPASGAISAATSPPP